MRRQAGQAGRVLAWFAHHVFQFALALFLLGLLLAGIASYRLSRGPLSVPWLAARIAEAGTDLAPGMQVSIGEADLAWEGFNKGGGSPLDLRLSHIVMLNPAARVRASISQLRVTLAPLKLLRGQIAPITVLARGSAIRVALTPGQAMQKSLSGTLSSFSSGPTHHKLLDLTQLRHVLITGAGFVLIDPDGKPTLRAPGSLFELTRTGNVTTAHATLNIAAPGRVVPVTLQIAPRDGVAFASLQTGAFAPALFADEYPALAALNLPVKLLVSGPAGGPFTLSLNLGGGTVQALGGVVSIAHGNLHAELTPGHITLDPSDIALAMQNGDAPDITMAGNAEPDLTLPGQGVWRGSITLGTAHVSAAALPHFWPAGLVPNTRKYVTTNITAGMVNKASFSFDLSTMPHFSGLRLDNATGSFSARGVSLTWLKGATPMTGLDGMFVLKSGDEIDITATKGQIAGVGIGHGSMTITGLSTKDQDATVDIDLNGDLPAYLAVLAAPPLSLLRASPVDLDDADGTARAHLTLALPLKNQIKLDQIKLAVDADLTAISLPLPLGQLTLSQGAFKLHSDLSSLSLKGTATLGDSPAAITVRVPFNGSGARQKQPLALHVQTMLDKALLAQIGTGAAFWTSGQAPLTADLSQNPNGQAQLNLAADLTPAGLSFDALNWLKKPGTAGRLALRVNIGPQNSASLDQLSLSAPALDIQARADQAGNVAFSRINIGRTTATGQLTPPTSAQPAWRLNLAGPGLDLSGVFSPKPVVQSPQTPPPPTALPPDGDKDNGGTPIMWQAEARFTQVWMRADHIMPLGGLIARASGAGSAVRAVSAEATTMTGAAIGLNITPGLRDRVIHLTSDDGGSLLASLGVFDTIKGGALGFNARLGNGAAGALRGQLVLQNFSLLNAPAFGKFMQALTIYGVADATSGPGLSFERLVAPFTFRDHEITLNGGRAFSSSLGFTASGRVNLQAGTIALNGTIIPAYALNALPGKIPLIGGLFAPEKGGGLFAARYNVEGSLVHPELSINPLSALTPGFLRDIFGPVQPQAGAGLHAVNDNKHP